MIAVTGASGYVGGAIVEHLRAAGVAVRPLSRREDGGREVGRFVLGERFDASILDGVESLVHAAWDFSVSGDEVRRRNVGGALALLRAACDAGARIVYVSSLSAFEGCVSLYGAAKLELEAAVSELGGVSLRPGLVCGGTTGGVVGGLVDAVRRAPVVPLPVGRGVGRLYVSDLQHLCELVEGCVTGELTAGSDGVAVLAAHPTPTTLRRVIEEVARSLGRPAHTLPLPWRVPYLVLRALEIAGARPAFRADSLIALANPIPTSQAASLLPSPVPFLPPRLDAIMMGSLTL